MRYTLKYLTTKILDFEITGDRKYNNEFLQKKKNNSISLENYDNNGV